MVALASVRLAGVGSSPASRGRNKLVVLNLKRGDFCFANTTNPKGPSRTVAMTRINPSTVDDCLRQPALPLPVVSPVSVDSSSFHYSNRFGRRSECAETLLLWSVKLRVLTEEMTKLLAPALLVLSDANGSVWSWNITWLNVCFSISIVQIIHLITLVDVTICFDVRNHRELRPLPRPKLPPILQLSVVFRIKGMKIVPGVIFWTVLRKKLRNENTKTFVFCSTSFQNEKNNMILKNKSTLFQLLPLAAHRRFNTRCFAHFEHQFESKTCTKKSDWEQNRTQNENSTL